MEDALISRRNLDFLLWEWLELEALLDRPRFTAHCRDGIATMIDLAEVIAAHELAPHLRAADRHGASIDNSGSIKLLPETVQALRLMGGTGLFATLFDEAHGGLQLPFLAHASALGLLMAGAVGTAFFVMLTVGNAGLIAAFGNEAQIVTFAKPQIAGQALGTMCLSEPHAGSSLADIRTQAKPDGADGLGRRFRITGSKMWISAGDHDATDNVVHLVLAKVPGPDGRPLAGTRGISLFIVPKLLSDGSLNDVSVAGVNHKMGQRALPNLAMNFGEGRVLPEGRAGAIGWLVGEVGGGLPQMFQMMNEARISVGLSSAMLALRGYQISLDYARERIQGRMIGGGPDPVAIIEHADVKRMLLAQKALAEGALSLVLYSARLLDEEKTAPDPETRELAGALLALLTPATKTWPSEMGQESLSLAMQVLGGAGYTNDFDVELLYRDNRLNPIHEGTTGIQAIDLVGRKIRRDKGEAFAVLHARVRASVEAARSRLPLDRAADDIDAAFMLLANCVERLIDEPEERAALANATAFLHAFGHAVVGWLWLDQAILCHDTIALGAGGMDHDFYAGKLRALHHFLETELPRVPIWLAQVATMSDTASAMPNGQF